MVHFTRACKTLLSENNKTRLTFEKQQEKNKNIICRPWSVRIEKNCALGLEHGPRPAASGRTQDLWHSFSQYGPPGRQIIYISWPAYDPFPVESRAKSQSGHKDVLAKQVRGTVSLLKYSKAHLQIRFVVSHISGLANCTHQTIKNVVPKDVGKVKILAKWTLRRRGEGGGGLTLTSSGR